MPRNNWGYNKVLVVLTSDKGDGRLRGVSEPAVLFLAALTALDDSATWSSKRWSEAAFSRPVGEFHTNAEVVENGGWEDVDRDWEETFPTTVNEIYG